MLGTMSKIEDMRKMREKQFEDAQRAATRQATNGVVKNGAAHAPARETASETGSAKEILVAEDAPKEEAAKPERKSAARSSSSSSSKKGDAVEGRCSACGKVKALQNGLIANHQKGFGRMCVGSRKEPA